VGVQAIIILTCVKIAIKNIKRKNILNGIMPSDKNYIYFLYIKDINYCYIKKLIAVEVYT